MKRYKKLTTIKVMILLLSFSTQAFAIDSVIIGAPQDPTWTTIIPDAESATTDPYDPFNAGTAQILLNTDLNGFTGIQIRAKFTAAMGTDPIVSCFGKKGSNWVILRDANGGRNITLSDDSTLESNTNDDTNYWTDPSEKIDALGASHITCTVVTAGVSASGTIAIEASRY